MHAVSITEFKAKCLRLIEDVRKTGESLEIKKRGKIVAIVTPPPSEEADWTPGKGKDTILWIGDVESPVLSPEEWFDDKQWS